MSVDSGQDVLARSACRRAPIKAVLNVSSHALMELVAVSVFLALGGEGFASVGNLFDLTHVTRAAGIAALVAFIAAHLANNLIVTGAIALSSGRSIRASRAGEPIARRSDSTFLAIPLVFVFAWVYAAFGAIAAATLVGSDSWSPSVSPHKPRTRANERGTARAHGQVDRGSRSVHVGSLTTRSAVLDHHRSRHWAVGSRRRAGWSCRVAARRRKDSREICVGLDEAGQADRRRMGDHQGSSGRRCGA